MSRFTYQGWSFRWIPASMLCVAIGCQQEDPNAYETVSSRRSAPDNGSAVIPTNPQASPDSSVADKANDSSERPTETASTDAQNPPKTAIAVPAGSSQVDDRTALSALEPINLPSANEPPKIEVLIKDKKFRTDRVSRGLLVSFEDLDMEKVLNMKDLTENVKDLMPDWLTQLGGKKVRIRGFMKPTFVSEGIERFVLARDTQACCFGPNPKMDYLVDVMMKKNTSTNYIDESRAFDVVGTFKIEPEIAGGKFLRLYVIEDAEIIDRR